MYAETTPERILLGSTSIPDAYRPAVATQIKHRRLLANKLPRWAELSLYIPEGINLEQASSQLSAEYKQRFIDANDILLDMTGGLGVDFAALMAVAKRGVYLEQNLHLIAAAAYNLPRLLPEHSYKLQQGDSILLLDEVLHNQQPTFLYIDPARREDLIGRKRVYAIEDCTPNLYEVLRQIQQTSIGTPPRLLVKLSPMLDLKHTLEHIPHVEELEILAVRGEVKELLVLINLATPQRSVYEIPIHATDLLATGHITSLTSNFSAEAALPYTQANAVQTYIYEPNAALMKSGLYRSIAQQYGLRQLHRHTHLYTHDCLLKDFAGRIMEVEEIIPFRSSMIKGLGKRIDRCMIACRNFPLGAEALRQKLGIKDGGDRMLLGTTLPDDSQALLLCRLLLP